MPSRRRIIAMTLTLPSLMLASRPALAAGDWIYSEGGLAIRGADPVGFFAEGAVVMGHEDVALMWGGAVWLFASVANRERFEMNPKAYAPRYGGYCAFDLSRGHLSSTLPETWTIHEDRLYLTHNLEIRDQWRRDIPGNIARADANWPEILGH